MNQKATEEYIGVPYRMTARWGDTAGDYLTRFLIKLRDKEEIWANKCPKCKRIIFPPQIVCGWCKSRIEDKEENWIQLGNEGTLKAFYQTVGRREVDPSTGWIPPGQTTNPIGFITPDGGDEVTFIAHILEETDVEKLRAGMRVQAVWKPKEERKGRIRDIKFWRILEE